MMTSLLFVGLTALAGLSAGCASDDVTGDEATSAEALRTGRGRPVPARDGNGGPGVVDVDRDDHGGASVCGVRGARACATDEFCDFPAGSLCGAADEPGHCKPRPEACTEQYAPVCGCDGKTYGNECEAHAAGIDVSSKGRCGGEQPEPPRGQECGGIRGLDCEDGEFCNLEPAAGGLGCHVADATGVCQPRPEVCTREYAPVCGCDGKTYGNACEAHAAGASIAQKGECGKGRVCGGLLGASCGRGEFCNFEGHTTECGLADGTGVCEPTPEGCTLQYDPVCGCDGNTYGNRCEANAKGVSVASRGECAKPERVNCDQRDVLCRRAPPVCPRGQVPSVEGSCFGDCVDIAECACAAADECPDRNQYVCHMSAGRCGPYLR